MIPESVQRTTEVCAQPARMVVICDEIGDSPMPHSFISSYMHCVFSTKGRLALITPEIQPRLWSYIGGIARKNGMKAIAIGGIEDHVHALLTLPATISFAKAV
jgi:putative transposase